jgi:hypothetical protein
MHVRTIADHARIVDALKVNRCPDCSNLGFEPGARRPGTNKLSKDYYCLVCGAGFNVSPTIIAPEFIERIGRKKVLVRRIKTMRSHS